MGEPKGLLPHPDGTTLIEHVVGVARSVTSDVVILGESFALPASLADVRVLPDAQPDAGPLAGLCSLLEHARDRWALLLACDMPNLRASLVRQILSHVGGEVDAIAFRQGQVPEVYHACCAAYHPRARAEVLREIAEGKASVQNVLRSLRLVALDPGPEDTRQLTNVNTPEDHARMLRESALGGQHKRRGAK